MRGGCAIIGWPCDWRAWERKINRLDQRILEVDGVTIHVVMTRGVGSNPRPILMTNE